MSADDYTLRITAGPDYNEANHVEVPVNSAKPTTVTSALADIELNVRIQNYQGLPLESPTTSPYFDTEPHAYNQDQYSIAFRFTPKAPGADTTQARGVSALDLQFGNDFDHPIRDRLPPGFNTAMSIVKWWIDPGLDGDAYADRPHLYGPALSSFNTVHVGAGEYDESKGGLCPEEGGDDRGVEMRQDIGAPEAAKARMKWALRDDNKAKWVFEYGKTVAFDFYNPYLDFSNLALRLPGFHLPIMKYWDGQGLRYVLRNKETEQTYLVVLFTIIPKDFVNEDGTVKDGARGAAAAEHAGPNSSQDGDDERDEAEALEEAEKKLGPPIDAKETPREASDDVD